MAIGPTVTDDDFLQTIRHEYFHATQYAYPNVRAYSGEPW